MKMSINKLVTYEQWELECQSQAEELVGITDLLDPKDPYSLHASMRQAFRRSMKPRTYIRKVFEEDIAAKKRPEKTPKLLGALDLIEEIKELVDAIKNNDSNDQGSITKLANQISFMIDSYHYRSR